jgi:hypothetical protein
MAFRDGLAATRDRALLAMRAMAGATAGRMLWLSGLLAVIILAVIWWPELRERFTPRYDGQIIVNSPAVFTRQRLVNDRLAQSAWLQEQLRVTSREFDSAFRSIDEVRSIRNSSATRGQIGIGGAAGGATPAATTPADEAKSDAATPTVTPTSADLFRAKNTYRDEVRAEIMETQLDDRHDIQGNTIYRLSFDATVLPGTRSDALAVIKVKLLHAAEPENGALDDAQAKKKLPRDAQAEKAEAESKRLNQVALDDEYFQLYEDWLRFMQRLVQKSVTNITQTLLERKPDDRTAQTLPIFLLKRVCEHTQRRLDSRCDPAVEQDENDKEASKPLKAASKIMSEFTAAYLAARSAIFQDQLRLNIITAAKKFNKEPEAFLYALDESYQLCQKTEKEFHKTDWSTGYSLQVSCPVVNGQFEGIIGATILYNELNKALPGSVEEAQQVTSRVLETLKMRCPDAQKATCSLPDVTRESLRCLAADYMWSLLNLHDRPNDPTAKFTFGHRFDRYFKVRLVGSETGMCNVVFLAKERAKDKDADDPVTSMKRDLNEGVEVYAYSITPKNLAQRLSTASDSRDAMQALLNANFSAGGRDVSSLIETLQKKSIQSQAIQALPIVVGYGLAPAVAQKPPYTEFGWVIAPQLKIGTQNERAHSDRQYPLAAVISVPSWWRSMNLAIETCWVERADLHNRKQFSQCDADGDGPAKHTVRLPGAISELSRKLGYEFVQEPRLEYRYPLDAPLQLEVGRPAQVLLLGGRIWRSTEVTLGAQKADEIAVLPNMEGILAKFRCVRRQANEKGEEPEKGAVLPIRVWTSEGVTDPPEYAILVEPARTEETKDKPLGMCPEEFQEMQAPTAPKAAEQPR